MSNKKQFSILVIGLLVFMVALVGGEVAHADTGVFINEIHADPASGLAGDANGDGIRDGDDDEFVEIVNNTGGESGYFWLDSDGWFWCPSYLSRRDSDT